MVRCWNWLYLSYIASYFAASNWPTATAGVGHAGAASRIAVEATVWRR